MNVKIKVLRDTPVASKDTMLTVAEFRELFPTVVNEYNTDNFLINYLKVGFLSDYIDTDLSKWFEVIEKSSFKLGDWVYHEGLNAAFYITEYSKNMLPNEATFEAVQKNLQIYKRLATKEEIANVKHILLCDDTVFISKTKCYYFENVWKEIHISHIKNVIIDYFNFFKETIVLSNESKLFNVSRNGIKIGCKTITNSEMIMIRKLLN